MSEKAKDDNNEDSVNNNTLAEVKPIDKNEEKLNNILKNRLRKYIKKLDGKSPKL